MGEGDSVLQGKLHGLPLEAWTVEVYYNKKTLSDLGVEVPGNLKLDAATLKERRRARRT